jgi:hypothetical protein
MGKPNAVVKAPSTRIVSGARLENKLHHFAAAPPLPPALKKVSTRYDHFGLWPQLRKTVKKLAYGNNLEASSKLSISNFVTCSLCVVCHTLGGHRPYRCLAHESRFNTAILTLPPLAKNTLALDILALQQISSSLTLLNLIAFT